MLNVQQKLDWVNKYLAKKELDDVLLNLRKEHRDFFTIDFRNNKNVYLDADKRASVERSNNFIIDTMRKITIESLYNMENYLGKIW
jgi:hypothetical protein